MSAYVPLAQRYDVLTRDVPYDRFADFYERLWEKYGIRPTVVLDLACGTGTLTAILAKRGYEMIAVDGSEEMLSEAQDKIYDPDIAVTPMLLCQDMTELDLYGTVNACVCSLDGINYLPPEELKNVFHRLRLFIEPGGVLIFDINTPEKLRAQDGEAFIDETDDVFCVWRAELEGESLHYGIDLFLRDGKKWTRSREEHTEYLHTTDRLVRELEKEGFTEIRLFGELREEEPAPGEQRIFIAARRNNE